jgi:hypothetical protein
MSMRAFMGLSSTPVQVDSISCGGITLRVPDLREIRRSEVPLVELVNDASTFRRLVKMEIIQIETNPKGWYSITGKLVTPLGDEDLTALRS